MKYSLLNVILEVDFIPYLIVDGNKTKKLSKNKLSEYVITKKIKTIKKIVKKIFDGMYEIKKYKFDINSKLIKVLLKVSSKYIKFIDVEDNNSFNSIKIKEKFTLDKIKKIFKDDLSVHFGNSKKLIGSAGPDTWMSNNIELIKEDEFDSNSYELGVALKKLNIKLSKNNDNLLKKTRPSPSQSSKLFKIGTIKKGNDGNKWIVKKVGKSVRWIKYN